jgi:hypothetical protein
VRPSAAHESLDVDVGGLVIVQQQEVHLVEEVSRVVVPVDQLTLADPFGDPFGNDDE